MMTATTDTRADLRRTPKTDTLADLRRRLAGQEQELAALTQSVEPELLDRVAHLTDSVLSDLDDAVGQLAVVRRPVIPVVGLRA